MKKAWLNSKFTALLENYILTDVLMNPILSDVDTLLSQISHHHGHLLPRLEWHYLWYLFFSLLSFILSHSFMNWHLHRVICINLGSFACVKIFFFGEELVLRLIDYNVHIVHLKTQI